MNKIISVQNNVIKIGMENGGIKEVRRDDVNFEPKVGDRVEIFEDETSCIVIKAEEKEKQNNIDTQSTSGINININNSNNEVSPNKTTYSENNEKKVVNKLAYILLAIFLGGVGAHKFYSGKVGEGILFLLLCWSFIPYLIAIIEIIVALCKKSDANGNILV